MVRLAEFHFDRALGPDDARSAVLSYVGELDEFEIDSLIGALLPVYERQPILAVMSQEGQWGSGERVVELDDEEPVRRLSS